MVSYSCADSSIPPNRKRQTDKLLTSPGIVGTTANEFPKWILGLQKGPDLVAFLGEGDEVPVWKEDYGHHSGYPNQTTNKLIRQG